MTAPADTVLVLRCCRADRVALRGFVWPSQGPVSCDDWSPEPVCGGGLHGWLWGAGDLHASIEAHEYPGAVWLVVEVAADQVVDLGGQVKFPRGSVVYCGDRDVAVEMIRRRAPAGTATMFATVTGGHRATVTGGDHATVTGGHRATVTGGHGATVTGGYRATVTGGDHATVTGGHGATVTGGDHATVTGGHRATVTGGHGATVTGGHRATVTGGHGATVTGGYRATVTGGDHATVTGGDHATVTGGHRATVTGGDHATVTGGDHATVTGGYRATVTGGHGATLSILYWCPKRERWRRAIAEAGEGGIEPGTAYVLDAANKFVKAGAK